MDLGLKRLLMFPCLSSEQPISVGHILSALLSVATSLASLTCRSAAPPPFAKLSMLVTTQVGCKALLTGVHGALLNVKINMKSIKDQDYCSKVYSCPVVCVSNNVGLSMEYFKL